MFEKESHNQDTKRIFCDGCTDRWDKIVVFRRRMSEQGHARTQCQHWDQTTSKELGNDSSHVQPLKLCEAIRAGKLTLRQAQGEALPVPSTAPTCDSRMSRRTLEDMDAKIEDETARDYKGAKRQLRSVKWGLPSTWHRTGLRSRHGEIPAQFSVHDDSNDMETMSVDDFTDLDTSERSKGKLWRYT